MTSQLTSVRLEEATLDHLRLLAEVDGSNIAEIIRSALSEYLRKRLADPTFAEQVDRANSRRRELLDEFVKHHGGSRQETGHRMRR